MTAFILIDAEIFSYLISSLFVAAAMFAMQSLRQAPPIFNYWSIAFAIGGFRYLSASLVSSIGLQYTIILLDALLIVQAVFMLLGGCCLRQHKLSLPIMLLVAFVLLVWGMVSSKMVHNWIWHDLPILLTYSLAMITSAVMFISRKSRKEDLSGLQITVTGLIISSALLYLMLLFIKPESDLHWFFIVDQGILIALGITLILGILNNLQRQVQHITPLDRTSGAYSHTYFNHLLDTELGRAQRYQRPFAFLLCHIDGGESNTEACGELTRTIVKSLRSVDFVGKVSNIEFVIALPETSISDAKNVAERKLVLAKAMNDKLELKSAMSVKLVLACYEKGENAERLYSRCKAALEKNPESDGIINLSSD